MNPLDYKIADPDAMRYALMNDAGYKKGGQVKERLFDEQDKGDWFNKKGERRLPQGNKKIRSPLLRPPKGTRFPVTDPKMEKDVDFSRYPIKKVPVEELYSIQNNVREDNLKPERKHGKPIHVVIWKGKYWVVDGNHRASEFWAAGEKNIHAHVLNLDDHPEMEKKIFGGVKKMATGGQVTQDDPSIDDMRFAVQSQKQYAPEVPQVTQQGDVVRTMPSAEQQRYLNAINNPSVMDQVVGAGEAGMSFLTGIPAYVAGIAGYGKGLVTGQDPNQTGADWESKLQYQPTTPMGQERTEQMGNVLNALDPIYGFAGHAGHVVSPSIAEMRAGLRLAGEQGIEAARPLHEAYMEGKLPMVAPAMFAAPEGKAQRVLAPANEMGFYSPVEAAALNLQRKSGNGQAFLNDIMKGENVRPDEISTIGLDTFLSGKNNVTANEVKDYITQNKIQLGETTFGGDQPTFQQWLKSKGHTLDEADMSKKEMDLINQYKTEFPERGETSFEEYSTPGGNNYREVVLTLPSKPMDIGDAAQNYYKNFVQRGGEPNWSELPEIKQREIISSMPNETKLAQPIYQSSHWDEPNPIAHLRMKDFTDVEGKKTLLVDEVQSDWHQAGREQGYKTNSTTAQTAYHNYVDNVKNKFAESVREEYAPTISHPDTLNKQVKKIVEDASVRDMANKLGETDKFNDLYKNYNLEISQNKQGVPNAPFKDDWYQLALKRAIKEAIDGGYDRVALPTGQKVSERFDLSKQVDAIRANLNPDGTYQIGVKPIGKNMQKFDESVPANKLAGIVGKDLANKITSEVNAHGIENGKVFSGLDLTVGGEGMKKYYDEVYPNYLKKFGKKYGAKIGKTEVTTPHKYTNEELSELFDSEGRIGESYTNFVYRVRDQGKPETLHYMDITPAMRQAFKGGIHMKNGGIVKNKVQFEDNLDGMRHELTRNK